MTPGFLEDPLEETRRIVLAAEGVGVALRAAGGIGIALTCLSASRPPLSRTYQDIDVVGLAVQSAAIGSLLTGLGYEPELEFNSLHGQRRLFFLDRVHQRQVDVFLDAIEACHRLELRDRLRLPGPALPLADLLLSKLQVVETTEKDFQDAIAVLADHELTADESGISRARLAAQCSNDWGWWRTATMVAERLHARARELVTHGHEELTHVPDRLRELVGELEAMPKGRKWKLRARVGDRVRWYELPEAIDHEI